MSIKRKQKRMPSSWKWLRTPFNAISMCLFAVAYMEKLRGSNSCAKIPRINNNRKADRCKQTRSSLPVDEQGNFHLNSISGLQVRETQTFCRESSKGPQRDWNISPLRRGCKSWDCSAWRKEWLGGSCPCLEIPEGR